MKRLRILTLILLILSVGAFFATNALRRLRADSTLPQISCGDDVLYLSVEDGRDAMLQGMNAWDGKDGDLTGDIVVERVSGGEEKGQLTVSYAVADSDRHVAGYTRTVVYTDYRSPQFYLSKPLRYGVGEDIQVRDRLGALDQIDGTISDRIKVSTDSLQTYYAGLYPVTVEVTNSLGDTASLTLDIEIYDSIFGEPVIQLDRYLVYLDSAAGFDPDSYISSVTGAPESSVRVSTPAGGLRPGVNRITYRCTGTNGLTGSTVLYAIIQE